MNFDTSAAPAPLTVLLVDPGWLRRQLGALAARRAGACVCLAANAEQALQQLEQTRIDIAVLACDTAGCHADKVLSHLQRRMPWVYCIALSYAVADDQLEYHFAVGYDDFIQRPFTTDRMRVAVQTAMEVQQLASLNHMQQPASEEECPPGLHAQLFVYLLEETDALFDMLSPERFEPDGLRRGMHRMRSGLLLLGYRALADECRDLERDCEQAVAASALLARRGWRIARQIRALNPDTFSTSVHSRRHNESGLRSTSG